MVQKVNQLLNDKAWARWTALVLIASMMFFGYMFVDVMSPIQALMESQKGWGPDTFGTYAASEYIVNVRRALCFDDAHRSPHQVLRHHRLGRLDRPCRLAQLLVGYTPRKR